MRKFILPVTLFTLFSCNPAEENMAKPNAELISFATEETSKLEGNLFWEDQKLHLVYDTAYAELYRIDQEIRGTPPDPRMVFKTYFIDELTGDRYVFFCTSGTCYWNTSGYDPYFAKQSIHITETSCLDCSDDYYHDYSFTTGFRNLTTDKMVISGCKLYEHRTEDVVENITKTLLTYQLVDETTRKVANYELRIDGNRMKGTLKGKFIAQ